jgi:hypothetical protein
LRERKEKKQIIRMGSVSSLLSYHLLSSSAAQVTGLVAASFEETVSKESAIPVYSLVNLFKVFVSSKLRARQWAHAQALLK